VIAALEYAARTGRGQLVEASMLEIVLNVTAAQTIEYEVFGTTMVRQGNRGHGKAIQNIYRCAGDDDWIAVTLRTDSERDAMSGFAGGQRWTGDRDDIDARLGDWFATRDRDDTVELLAGAGIPAAAVVSPSLVTENPQLRHRGFLQPLTHPRTGPGLYPCPPFARLDGTTEWLARTPPMLGEHNTEVLTQLCGLSEDDLCELTESGVIGTRPKGL
jgi:crotonobetainyl-CoA:carnitine CoA-transferase CaiB-like acyl-CoA transferase